LISFKAPATLILGLLLAFETREAAAEGEPAPDFSSLSIQDLASIDITSVSKRAEPLSQAAASVFLITNEDIRRSGATSIPEVLRLAPNLEVQRLDASTYAITARGFNSPEAGDKLQVLVDGRSVYSPLGSTIFWEALNIDLDDVDRIEVISGPGGTLYGANAVNGVINIITRNAKDTVGNLVDAGGGNADRSGTVRSGAKFGEGAAVRVYATGFDRSATSAATPRDITIDPFSGAQGGFRLDDKLAQDAYTVQGDLYRNYTLTGPGNPASDGYKLSGGNALARWTHTLDAGSTVQLQAFYDKDNRVEPYLKDLLDTYDIQLQHNIALGAHQVVWGAEYRLQDESVFSQQTAFLAVPNKTMNEADIFGQDEIDLGHRLRLTLGLKLEYDTYAHFEPLPTGRLAWQPTENSTIWAGIQRAVRIPSRLDRELQANLGSIAVVRPSDFQPETLSAFEVGARGQPIKNVTYSISVYYNIYDKLRTVPLTPTGLLGIFPLYLGNGLQGDTYGIEAWGTYQVLDWWQLRPGLNWLHKNLDLVSGATDTTNGQSGGQDPRIQMQLRSAMNLAPAWELDVALRYVGPVKDAATPGNLVSDYAEADARLGWHVTDGIELSVTGANLLHSRHIEASDASTLPPRTISRSFYLDLRAKF
jgi:iron complex outermembrane recepter protein